MPDARRLFGDAGERLAERSLLERGWTVVERNARTRYGEIDLICHDGRAFVFVEVKTRRSSSFVRAVEAVDARKIARLELLATAWLSFHGRQRAPWRLAVAAITVGLHGATVDLIDDPC